MKYQIPGIICFLIGGAFIIYLLWSVIRRRKIRGWAVTQGTIIESRLERVASSYDRVVCYSYLVNGQSYINDKVSSPYHIYKSKKYSEKLIKPYTEGNLVNVYFDPADPADAVLERGRDLWADLLHVLIALVFIAIGVGFFLEAK